MTRSAFTDGPSTYFERLGPTATGDTPTVMMVHGGAHTGACYLATADGRPGWAQHFAAAGYPVVVADWPGVGRSGYVPHEALSGEMVCAGLQRVLAAIEGAVVLLVHSMSGAYGWRLLEQAGDRIGRLVAIAPASPGNIQPEAEIVQQTAETIEVRGTTSYTLQRHAPFVPTPGFARSKLVGDSEHFPLEYFDRYAASLSAIPPRLLQQRLNINGSQLKVSDQGVLRGKPVLVVTGDRDVDHPRAVDGAVVGWLQAAGARAEFCWLPEHGHPGHGHMMMLERNSDTLAALIGGWIAAG